MTGKEWSKLCKEHGVVVIDVNYKNMTHEDAIKFFDLLNSGADMKKMVKIIQKPYWYRCVVKVKKILKIGD